jgi:flagellar motility protein MotE (MotC chaperone)
MNRGRKIFFLLLINLGLVFVSLYILDMLQIIDYKQILSQVPGLKEVYKVKVEDPYLLEKAELDKKWQILDEKVRNLKEDRKKLEDDLRNLAEERDKIDNERESVRNMVANFSNSIAERDSYDKRVDAVADQVESMEPKAAVAILSKQDDMMLIDIFKKMNARAEDKGTKSTVSYLLTLMDSEQAARIQRKMLQ